MEEKKKQKDFEALYIKFLRKCIAINIVPAVTLKYEHNGIFPVLDYFEIDETRKKELLSSLEEEK